MRRVIGKELSIIEPGLVALTPHWLPPRHPGIWPVGASPLQAARIPVVTEVICPL